MLFRCPIDTDLFDISIPMEKRKEALLVLNNRSKPGIPHNEMPMFYNQYQRVGVDLNGYNESPSVISPLLVSVSGMEAAACGCRVEHHPYMNRQWVLENASIGSQTERLLGVYKECGV